MFKILTDDFIKKVSNSHNELIEVTTLPSLFKTYTSNSFFVRGLTVGEVKTLNRTKDNSLTTLIKIYSNVISGCDILELLPVDLKALMFYIAKLTDDNYAITANTSCPKCDNNFSTKIDIQTIEFNDLEASLFEFEDFKFYPIRLRDVVYAEQLDDGFDPELVFLSLSKEPSISVSNNESLFNETYNLLSSLPANKYVNKLSEILKKVLIDVKSLQLQCNKCEYKFNSALNLDFARIYL